MKERNLLIPSYMQPSAPFPVSTNHSVISIAALRPVCVFFQGYTTGSPAPRQEPVSSLPPATSSSAPESSTRCASPVVTRRCATAPGRRNGHRRPPPSRRSFLCFLSASSCCCWTLSSVDRPQISAENLKN